MRGVNNMSNKKLLYPLGVIKKTSGKMIMSADTAFKAVTSVSKRPKRPSLKPSKNKPK